MAKDRELSSAWESFNTCLAGSLLLTCRIQNLHCLVIVCVKDKMYYSELNWLFIDKFSGFLMAEFSFSKYVLLLGIEKGIYNRSW